MRWRDGVAALAMFSLVGTEIFMEDSKVIKLKFVSYQLLNF